MSRDLFGWCWWLLTPVWLLYGLVSAFIVWPLGADRRHQRLMARRRRGAGRQIIGIIMERAGVQARALPVPLSRAITTTPTAWRPVMDCPFCGREMPVLSIGEPCRMPTCYARVVRLIRARDLWVAPFLSAAEIRYTPLGVRRYDDGRRPEARDRMADYRRSMESRA